MPNASTSKAANQEWSERVRRELSALKAREQLTQRELARRLRVTQATVSEFLSGKQGIGPKLMQALLSLREPAISRLLNSPDGVAHDADGRMTEEHFVKGTRYPNRDIAIRSLSLIYPPDEVQVAADAHGVALDADSDPEPLWWRDRIENQLLRLRRIGKGSDTPVTDAHDL